MRRRHLAVPVVVIAAAGGCGGDGADVASRREEQVRAAAREAGLPADVTGFLAGAAASVGEEFRVTYELGGDPGGTAELAQDPPRRRVDLSTTVDGRPVTRAVIVDGDEATVCERVGGAWTCRPGGADDGLPGAFGEAQVEQAVRDPEDARGAYRFRFAAREVGGVDARCLVTELRPGAEATPGLGGKGTLCLSAEGVPLLVETPAASLRAVRYTTDVDASAFRLPAAVTR